MITYALILFFKEFHYWAIQTQNSIVTFWHIHDPNYLTELILAAVEVVVVVFASWAGIEWAETLRPKNLENKIHGKLTSTLFL